MFVRSALRAISNECNTPLLARRCPVELLLQHESIRDPHRICLQINQSMKESF